MKTYIIALAFVPSVAFGQSSNPALDALRRQWALDPSPHEQPIYGIPVQPVLPVPRDNGPWGTGYSVVTTTREKVNIFDRDLTGQETVQRIVPNGANGQPLKGFDLGW